jgi:hypothetical protein
MKSAPTASRRNPPSDSKFHSTYQLGDRAGHRRGVRKLNHGDSDGTQLKLQKAYSKMGSREGAATKASFAERNQNDYSQLYELCPCRCDAQRLAE